MADRSSEFVVNVVVTILVLLGYILSAVLKAKKRRRPPAEPVDEEPPPPELTAQEAREVRPPDPMEELQTLLGGEGDPLVEGRKGEALALQADIVQALAEAVALRERTNVVPALAALDRFLLNRVIGPLEETRRLARAFVDAADEAGQVVRSGDVTARRRAQEAGEKLFGGAAFSDASRCQLLLAASREIVLSHEAQRFEERAAPSRRIAEAFFDKLRFILKDLDTSVTEKLLLPVESARCKGLLLDRKLADAGLLVYPAYTRPAATPLVYGQVAAFIMAGVAQGVVTRASLAAAGLGEDHLWGVRAVAADYLATLVMGPAHLFFVARTVNEGELLQERAWTCASALAASGLRDGGAERVAKELFPEGTEGRAAGFVEAVLGLPLLEGNSLAELGAKGTIRFDYGAACSARDALARGEAPSAVRDPLPLYIGAAMAEKEGLAGGRAVAALLDSLLRGETHPTAARTEERSAAARAPATGPFPTEDDILGSMLLGCSLGRLR